MFNNDCLSKITAFDWYKVFKDGLESIVDDPRYGRPSILSTNHKVDRVREFDREFRRESIESQALYSHQIHHCETFLYFCS